MTHPIQYDDNGFRIFRNGLCPVAVLTAAPMLDIPMSVARLLPKYLGRIATDNKDTHWSAWPFDEWQQDIPAATCSLQLTHGCD
jgi:hypothetical protein